MHSLYRRQFAAASCGFPATAQFSCIICECQAYAVFDFAWNYALPIGIFAYSYARIFHTIRRQSKVVAGHVGRSQDVPMATTSRDPNAGQVQQQATGTTTGAKLSHTYYYYYYYCY